jgi:hypothetical protein
MKSKILKLAAVVSMVISLAMYCHATTLSDNFTADSSLNSSL